MNSMQALFDDEVVRLAQIDHEKDAEVAAKWNRDSEYLRLMSVKPARPLSAEGVKKMYEELEKQAEQDKNLFYFTIRLRADERLIGFAQIGGIEWAHGNGFISLGIGEADDRRRGYGWRALRLLVDYAFDELNLYRLTAMVPEYNQAALGLFFKAGFVMEVCRRQALNRDGQRWDMLHQGLLRDDWRA